MTQTIEPTKVQTKQIRTFSLSPSFLSEFKDKQPEWGYNGLGYVVYKRTYAREKPDGNLEEFWETCQRVVEGTYDIQKRHCKTLRLTWDDRKAQRSAQEMYRRMWEFKWLPPGRGLWMMGTPNVERIGSAALNNCFSGETEVLFFRDGKIGSGLLSDLVDSKLELFLENGEKVPAIIQHVGKQKVYKAVFKVPGRSKYCLSYDVTKDHRWILADGMETTELKVGDRVGVVPVNFDVDKNSQIYKRGFSHGLIFGDGTRHTYYPNRHFIRLCGEKEQKHIAVLESMPEHLSTTHPQTYNNDSVVTLVFNDETNWKELPLGDEGIEYFRAFVDGWMAADSHIEGKDTICLDSSNYKACVWLAKIAPLIGYTVSGWSVETRDTNFGPRTFPLNRIKLRSRKTTMELVSFDEGEEVDVYCPLVPTHHRFMLFGGIVTGNCAFISTKGVAVDFAQPFCWMMDMLMLGLGVGFDTKGAGLVKIKKPNVTDVPFVVEDSREGWVALLRVVLDSYTGRGALPSVIDYSLVRPFGAPIKGFGGTSSGPDPLIELIKSVQDILNKIVDSELTTSAIVDICNLVGRCVVSGNVRRSAEIAFGDPNDEAFLNLKNPEINQEALNHHRWASNNSIFAEVGMDYSKVAEMTAKNGEPGYQWLENARAYSRMNGVKDFVDALAAGANPCVEQTLEDGEICCLVETFPGRHESFEDYRKTLKYAYLYAKTVTLIPTHDHKTNTVVMRNRRIGCSMSGIVQAVQKFGRRKFFTDFCDAGYGYLRELDKKYSGWLCVRTSIKITSVKPSGSVSLLPGVTPGIHFPHSEFYIRRVRLQSSSPLVKVLESSGYHIEKDSYSPNTVVAEFPVHESNFDRSKDSVTLWEQLEMAAQMQQYWADNQVSVTVTFKPEEARDIKYALELYETRLKGVSFLPIEDHGYAQAPYEEITKEEYEKFMSGIRPISAETLAHEETSKFCDGESCTI